MLSPRLAGLGKLSWGNRAYALFLLCATTAVPLPAQTFTTLRSFDGADGYEPTAALVQATLGDLYGTTAYGGPTKCATNSSYVGCGTIFRISPTRELTTLYNFCTQNGCPDGQFPFGGLVQATDGNFYGTTFGGGANGAGTVFKITPGGMLTTLHSFAGYPTDGGNPLAALVQATDGNFYGTTPYGGASEAFCGGFGTGCGTVFKITPGGTLTTLHSFDHGGGNTPFGALIQATNGNFYGTTSAGGANGGGTLFEITPGGTLTTLYNFCAQSNCTDGFAPTGAVLQASDGNFYGTTQYGGSYGDYGTIFQITSSGKLTTLHSFDNTDGWLPDGGLVQATDGNLYGATLFGGAQSAGTVFEITPSGTLTTLHNFVGPPKEGQYPGSGLVQDTNGKLSGTTESGGTLRGNSLCVSGSGGCGTVFGVSVGLGPFVETQTTSGKVGAAVKILGTYLTGATSVTFNGTAAVFKVVSSSLITTTVPTGATTGTVQVVTPSGTFSSNVIFRVAP
jgi:uncharacterized repeat protein (TIGR03803 family)